MQGIKDRFYYAYRMIDGTLSIRIIDRPIEGELPDLEDRPELPHYSRNGGSAGFECGYYGTGPSDLAFSLLIDALPGEGRETLRYLSQSFKEDIIGGMGRGLQQDSAGIFSITPSRNSLVWVLSRSSIEGYAAPRLDKAREWAYPRGIDDSEEVMLNVGAVITPLGSHYRIVNGRITPPSDPGE